jgi:hypothetical protein
VDLPTPLACFFPVLAFGSLATLSAWATFWASFGERGIRPPPEAPR